MTDPAPPNTLAGALRAVLNRNAVERATFTTVQPRVDEPSQQTPQQRRTLTFYDHVMHVLYEDDEEEMLNDLAFNRLFFESVLNLVDSVPLQRRGRQGFVHTHKDKLLFLNIFLKEGTGGLKKACQPRLTEPSSILRNLEHAIAAFKDVIVRNTVEFRNEQIKNTRWFLR